MRFLKFFFWLKFFIKVVKFGILYNKSLVSQSSSNSNDKWIFWQHYTNSLVGRIQDLILWTSIYSFLREPATLRGKNTLGGMWMCKKYCLCIVWGWEKQNPGTMIILQPITQAHKINLDQTHMPLSSSVCRAWKELNAMLTTVVVGSDGEASQLQLMNMLLIWTCHHYNNIHPEGDHEGWRVQRWQWW